MAKEFREELSKIQNTYRGGNPLEVQAAREVVYHLQEKGFAQEVIPTTDLIIYFGELYNTALGILKSKDAPRGDKA